jgi:chromosome segregation ATPase
MKTLSKTICLGIALSLLVVPLLFVSADQGGPKGGDREEKLNRLEDRNEDRLAKVADLDLRLKNREDIINRLRAKIASTTLASTTATSSAASTTKRLDNLDNRLNKQLEQMAKVKDRLLNKELKVIEVLTKISAKIAERISILEGKGLNMAPAKAQLALADAKIADVTLEANNLANLLSGTSTATTTDQTKLFQDIKTSQDKIRTMAREAHALLVDTIKEITKVLPRNGQATSTI